MWTASVSDVGRPDARRFVLGRGSVVASFAEVIDAWRSDEAFCDWFGAVLADVPFAAFRWETPAVTAQSAGRPFEFVVVDDPALARPPEPSVFAEHFVAGPGADILSFANLGGDAMLVVPTPRGPAEAYVHLAVFVRHAPANQRASLWRHVGEAMSRRVGASPVWLSTAGDGVAWLHVRLDDRPKYYAFSPYRRTR